METARGRRMPAIALTALTRREDRLQALRAHVAKPVKLAELAVILDSIIRMYPQEKILTR